MMYHGSLATTSALRITPPESPSCSRRVLLLCHITRFWRHWRRPGDVAATELSISFGSPKSFWPRWVEFKTIKSRFEECEQLVGAINANGGCNECEHR